MRTHALAAALALVLPFGLPGAMHADARGKRDEAIQRQAETSTLITGTIDITAQGAVVGYTIDRKEKLPPLLLEMAAKAVAGWSFEPVQIPENAVGRSAMSLLFVARLNDSGGYIVELREASFAGQDSKREATFDRKYFRPPQYPMAVLDGASVPGTVYLALRYDGNGRILDAEVEQVNLRIHGSEAQLTKWRDALAQACLDVAPKWRMKIPSGALPAGETYGIARVPVSFEAYGTPRPRYGEWRAYLPGPRKVIPWLQNTPFGQTRPDALPPDQVHGTEGRRLTKLLDGG